MPSDEQFRQAYRDAYRAAWSDADYRREALEKQAIGVLDRLEREFGDARYRLAKEALRGSGARPAPAPATRGRTAGMTGETSEPAVVEFRNDDEGYRDWLLTHRGGWVLNVGSPSDGLKLHRAICDTIRTRRAHTSGGYVKVCSTDRADLMAYARSIAEPSIECPSCDP